ncbi:ATP-binding cassette transporter abc4 [Sparassis crispa]|uniref:ATP-binding cassette transporter abc4 n=1 Tax=Sparassis crispa TaxID=139825 RepID=A0A401H2S6_9APHY|nr:ATP-binding cassette transporter abc4 [Sparassis crispa]GBE88702.1 ATP-binding cassette transporter abc4 [Sparassis crispa]
MWGLVQGSEHRILYAQQWPTGIERTGNASGLYTLLQSQQRILLDPTAIPAYVVSASILTLLVQLALQSKTSNESSVILTGHEGTETSNASEIDGIRSTVAQRIKQLGGNTIFAFKVFRLLLSVILLALSIITLRLADHGPSPESIESSMWFQNGVCAAFGYASLLALVSVTANPSHGRLLIQHGNLVLFVMWALYLYRDVWPLATYVLSPADIQEGPLLWAKLSMLTLAAVVIPLCVPREYVPLNPKEPLSIPSQEQTASILSMMLYTWLDNTIITANRIAHLSTDQLPVLADYDMAKNLVHRSFPYMDPFQLRRRRHMFWGIVRVFQTDFSVMGLMLFLRTIADFGYPIGINLVLSYVEIHGKDSVVRPWVWISFLFIGPCISTICFQWYIFISTRNVARITAIITQLVFDHALRARVKADVNEASIGTGISTAVATPDNVSETEPGSSEIPQEHSGGSSEEGEEGSAATLSVDTSSMKGKQKKKASLEDSGSTKPEPTATATSDEKGRDMVGKITNLISTDLNNITEGRDFLFFIIEVPWKIGLCIYLLYSLLGWSAFVGMAVIVMAIPLQAFFASKIQGYQKEKMKKTDTRVQAVTDVLGVMRMIKLFGWEPQVEEQLAQKRNDELKYQLKFKLFNFFNNYMTHIVPILTIVVVFVAYTALMHQELTAALVFSSIALLDMLRRALVGSFRTLPQIIAGKVSLDRVNNFLYETELLDAFSDGADAAPVNSLFREDDEDVIGIRNASFTWANSNDGTLTPGPRRRNFVLHIDDELTFKRGHINLIIGPTGSGKTSVLMALLGEMHYIPSGPDSYVLLPRAGGIAYAAQESWVLSETIRDNILFGAPFDEERYNKVIEQCGLQRDLSLFDAGDKTQVGEKGLTLSGGQKARITLARAVYSSAEVLLLDDVLAALDVHTAKWIVEKCFKGDLIRGRTVILVTHNVALASPISEFAVSLGLDGRIHSQGSLSKALEEDQELSAKFVEELKVEEEIIDEHTDAKAQQSDGKLFVSEEIAQGHVGWPAISMFVNTVGGRFPAIFWFVTIGMLFVDEVCEVLQPWFLGVWARQYEDHPSSEVSITYYMSSYSLLVLANVAAYSISYVVFLYGTLRAARIIHKRLMNSVLGATLRWLDVTPTSRIVSRCTEDVNTVDGTFSDYTLYLMSITAALIMRLVAVLVMSPIFTVPSVVLAMIGGWCGQLYVKAQLSVKREMGVAHAPVLENFGSAISGLTSIRAYGAQDLFRKQGYHRMDTYIRSKRTLSNLHRWVSTRIEILGAVFSTCLATYLVYATSFDASDLGYTLNMAVEFSTLILWWTLMGNQTEISANSLERIHQYTVVEHEPKATDAGAPPAYWPTSGSLKVEGLAARYSSNGPRVLQDISFDINSGEHIGIVGRTGSGKSSLTLALLRCIITEGKVYYDGVPTDSINLDALRSNITIIPQMPELLSGSLRQNLDPFEEHDDAELNDALRAAGLFSVQSETDEGRITLDSEISSAGGNLSVGQRQILALARAIVRRSKLLILDEATSAIDYETDTVIQMSLRKELGKDVTLLTIAHRLQTIMDADRIMVLDAGRVVEFDTPRELLKKDMGMFRALVDGSGDKDKLYALVRGGSASTSWPP